MPEGIEITDVRLGKIAPDRLTPAVAQSGVDW